MKPVIYEILMLFFTYSFLAWIAETTVATIKVKDFRNRGFASGPFCFIYGFTGVVLTVFLQDLKNDIFFLFLGSTIISTAVEWFAGKLLERMKQKKWWDYSDKKWNFDGYICLQYSLLWGLLGFLTVRYFNTLVLWVYHLLPDILGKAVIWVLLAVGTADILGSFMALGHTKERLPSLFKWNRKLQAWTYRLAAKISGQVEKRIIKAYPVAAYEKTEKAEAEEDKCGFVRLFWLFFIGALLGDIVETLFCRITAGEWMSRSSLVWGPFSIVWGLAIALFTALLYRDRDKKEHHIFWIGTFLGGAYEYICSVFTEIVFGKVFWDYSEMPFNLGGRINLLYCFFWGIAAVVWIKKIFPKVSDLITLILDKTKWILTTFLLVFMVADICVSMLALIRYDARAAGEAAVCDWERIVDERFDDERMEKIYPNAKPQ